MKISRIKTLIQHALNNKLTRFFLVSGLNTVFGYGLFAVLLFVGLAYPFALLVSTIAGILFNFKTIGNLVFKSNDNKLILKFIGVYGVTYLSSLGVLTLLKQLDINLYLGYMLLVVPMGLLAFLLNKKFVFQS